MASLSAAMRVSKVSVVSPPRNNAFFKEAQIDQDVSQMKIAVYNTYCSLGGIVASRSSVKDEDDVESRIGRAEHETYEILVIYF